VWTKSNGSYVTQASTLNANREKHPRNKCPHCYKFFHKRDLLRTQRNEENEIESWKFICPSCRRTLVVLND
jgi:Zn finger protein HypA/HybF involved in hydrogenase expression